MVRHDGSLKVLDFGITCAPRPRGPVRAEQARELGRLARRRADRHRDVHGAGAVPGACGGRRAPISSPGESSPSSCCAGVHPWGSAKRVADRNPRERSSRPRPPPIDPEPELPSDLAAAGRPRHREEAHAARFASMDALLDALEGSTRLPALRRGPGTGPAVSSTSRPVILGDLPPVARVTLAVGTRLADRYEVVRLLGRGGMGDVYEAIDGTGGAHVALKVVRADRSGDARAVERFQREVDLARRVVHPNVARVLDALLHESPTEAPSPPAPRDGAADGDEIAGRAPRATRRALRRGGEAHSRARWRLRWGPRTPRVSFTATSRAPTSILEPRTRGGALRVVVTSASASLARSITQRPGRLEPVARGRAPRDASVHGPRAGRRDRGRQDARNIYSLGVVLFEMVTASWLPFVRDTPIETALLRLPAPRPPVAPFHRPSRSTRGGTAPILRCLARDTRGIDSRRVSRRRRRSGFDRAGSTDDAWRNGRRASGAVAARSRGRRGGDRGSAWDTPETRAARRPLRPASFERARRSRGCCASSGSSNLRRPPRRRVDSLQRSGRDDLHGARPRARGCASSPPVSVAQAAPRPHPSRGPRAPLPRRCHAFPREPRHRLRHRRELRLGR